MQKLTPYHTSFCCIPGVQSHRHHRRHACTGYTGGAAQAWIICMCTSTCSYRDVRFAVLRRSGSHDMVTILLLSFPSAQHWNIIQLCVFLSYRIGSNALAALTTGSGEARILLFWCRRSSLRDSKSKSEFVPVLSSMGLEALYPLRHQEPSKYSLYQATLTIDRVSLSDDTKIPIFSQVFSESRLRFLNLVGPELGPKKSCAHHLI